MSKVYLFVIVLLVSNNLAFGQQLFINEVMSSDQNVYPGSDSTYPDWIEIYNNDSSAYDLQGCFLSDDVSDLYKWQFPAYQIGAQDFLIVRASDIDSFVGLQCGFKLNSEGECLYLTAADSSRLDSVCLPMLVEDQSYGRSPDAADSWYYFDAATANSSNATVLARLRAPQFSASAGFYSDSFTLLLSGHYPNDTFLYTLDGSEPSIYNIATSYYCTKQDYSTTDTINLSYRSYWYTNSGIAIVDRSIDTNKLCDIRPSPAWWSVPSAQQFKGTVVKARAYRTGYQSSEVITASYFVDTAVAAYTLPIVSISTAENYLFDYYSGIHVPGKLYYDSAPLGGYWPKINANYTQRGRLWERPAFIEYFDDTGQRELAQSVGIRIAGNVSRAWGRKSFRVYARSEYDVDNRLNYPFFGKLYKNGNPQQLLQSFKRFTIRNSGTNWNHQLFIDAFAQASIDHTGLDVQHASPAVVFINGEYWGLMNIRQRYDSRYLADHYAIEDSFAVILDGSLGSVNIGLAADSLHYVGMRSFVKNQDMSIPVFYDSIHQLIDIENFAALFMAQIYMNNSDWLSNNRKCWRKRTTAYQAVASYGQDGRYRWLVFDLDHAYKNPHEDRLDITLNTSGGSAIFEGLLENPSFKNYWINLMADHMNSSFLPTRLIGMLDSLEQLYQAEIAEHKLRWGGLWTNNSTQSMKDFAVTRPYYMRQFIINQFSEATDTAIVTLNVLNATGGIVQINTLAIDNQTLGVPATAYPWSGVYFKGVPVQLVALPQAGYQFVEWQGTGNTSDTLWVDFLEDTLLTAVFQPVDTIKSLYINEIVAKNKNIASDAAGDFEDYIEIYNTDTLTAVSLAGLYFTDDLSQATKCKVSIDCPSLLGHERALFWADKSTDQGYNHLSFNIDAQGDTLALFQIVGPDTILLDSVIFDRLDTDVSYGRLPEGIGAWYCSTKATPQLPNILQVQSSVNGLFINECMATNLVDKVDEFGEYDDWIELYNASLDTVCLKGLYLSDDYTDPFKYRISDSILIYPDSFVLFWADNQVQQGSQHLNFKLAASGEQISLVQILCESIIFIDSFSFGQQYQDVSYGRYVDAADSLQYFDFATAVAHNILPDFSGIFINELMADNDNACQDDYGENDDWIELYNADTKAIDVGGLYISDDFSDLSKYRLPKDKADSTTIEPGGYLLLWADNQSYQGALHLDFKLSAAGESIGLSRLNPWDTMVVDSISFGPQLSTISFGRLPDAGPIWSTMSYTPGASNVLNYNYSIPNAPAYHLFPNPACQGFSVIGDSINSIHVWTMHGQHCIREEIQTYIDMSNYPAGVYLVEISYKGGFIYKKLVLK